MKKMTGKERVVSAMRRQDVDYVPCCPAMYFQEWPQRMGKKVQFPFGPSPEETLDYMINTMGVDQTVTLFMECYPENGVTYTIKFDKNVVHKTWHTPSGDLHASVKYNEQWLHGMDIPLTSDYNPAHFIEPWIKNMNDIECLKHIKQPPVRKADLEAWKLYALDRRLLADRMQMATIFYHGTGLTGALNMFGPTALCEFSILDPELVEAYLELDHQYNMKCYEIALDSDIDIFRRNGFYESCDYYSPDMLERFLLKHLQEEIKIVHQAGKPIGYTLLTGIMPMLDYLKKLDFDSLMCPDIFFKNDGKKIVEALGDKKSFWSGPSDTMHLPFDNPDKVRDAVRQVFETFGKRGLILAPCSSSKGVFPWNNIPAMIDEWKKLR